MVGRTVELFGMRLLEHAKKFASHHLVQKTATLQAGGALGTLIQAVAGVILARLLQPELYGRYALAFSVASISSVFIGSGMLDAVTPAVSRAWATGDSDALRRAVGFYGRFFVVCALVTMVIAAFLPAITGILYRNSSVGFFAVAIVVASMISTTLFSLTQLTLQVAGRFRTLAGLTLTDVIVRYGAMVGLVSAGFGVWGAVSGHLIGAGVLFGVSAVLYLRVERAFGIVPPLVSLTALARQASWRPLLGPTIQVLADSNIAMLFGALPVAMVGLHAAGAELAYFKLAFGYIILAMSVMGPVSTVMNVHFPSVQTTDPLHLRATFVRVTLISLALSAAITAVVLLISPFVFRILYGEVYLPAVQYVYGFAVFGAFFGLGVGLGPMWRAVNRVRISIIINLVTLGLGVPLGLWLIARWHLWGAVAMVTLWYTLSHAISFTYLLRILKVENEPQ